MNNIRLQKYLASCGVASRRKCEEIILASRVSVNGVVVKELGTKVGSNDIVKVDGKVVHFEDLVYYALYKPTGYVSTVSDELGRRTILDLLDDETKEKRIYPIGRLDYDTSGIILLTNDGALAELLTNPKYEVEKEYEARIKGEITKEDLNKLRKGVEIEPGLFSKEALVDVKEYDKVNHTTLLKIVIKEGKNHEVRKMCENIGYPIKKLRRLRFDFITLDGLHMGQYRMLNPKEVKKLYNPQKNY